MTALVLALLLLGSPTPATPAAPPPANATSTSIATPTATPTPAPAAPAAVPATAVVPTAVVTEKIAQGDRLSAAGDLRNALFMYMDAVYAQPSYVYSRLKLGRGYLAMHYPDRAIDQAQKVLAVDPGCAEARKLIEDARAPKPKPVAPAPAPSGAADPAPRSYRLASDTSGSLAPPPPPRAAVEAAEAPAIPRAPELYRLGVDQVARREYAAAIETLTDAIARDPRFGIAYSARASAEFGLQRYRDAADDYKVALGLAPELATPLYGLGECYRLLGDPAAAEMYGRYAQSRARDVRDDLRVIAAKRAGELSGR